MKRIFLTGSKGFIGSHLMQYFKAHSNEYMVSEAGRNELPEMDYDYIIHLAATTTTSASFIPELFENNIVYAKQIMSYPIRTIYASSTSAAELINSYAYTKQYIEWLGKQHKNATGLRFFNVYGPNNNKGIIKKAIDCAVSGQKMTLTNGFQIRDFIYIDDVVVAIIKALDSEPGIVDIGTGNGTSIFNALRTIEKVLNKPVKYELYPGAKTDMELSIANPGLSNCLSLEDGLRKMINQ